MKKALLTSAAVALSLITVTAASAAQVGGNEFGGAAYGYRGQPADFGYSRAPDGGPWVLPDGRSRFHYP